MASGSLFGATYGSYDLFAQDEIRLGRLNLIAGARYSLVAMDFDIPRDTNLALTFGSVDRKFQAVTGILCAVFPAVYISSPEMRHFPAIVVQWGCPGAGR